MIRLLFGLLDLLLVFAVIVGGAWFIGSLLMVLAGLLWT